MRSWRGIEAVVSPTLGVDHGHENHTYLEGGVRSWVFGSLDNVGLAVCRTPLCVCNTPVYRLAVIPENGCFQSLNSMRVPIV